MDFRKRAGQALAVFRKPELLAKKAKEKLVVTELGAAFLDLSDRGLSNQKTVSDRLLKSFTGWVFANVSALAEEISKMEFELYTTRINKGEIEYVQIDSHPLLDLLDRFNPYTTTSDAMYLIEAHLELAGDTFLLLDNPNKPSQVFILEPDKVTVVPGGKEDGYRIKSFEYKPVDGEIAKYDPEYVIQIKTPNPSNPYRGKSVVEAGAIDIDTDNLAAEFLKAFFKNGAIINYALSSDKRITSDDIERITTDLRKNFGGAGKAFKTLILGGGLKPVPIQSTNKETEMVAIEEAMRDKIMAMFKNTKSSLGIVEDVNRANAEASILAWKRNVIKPKMQRIVDTLNEFLVPRFGTNLILSFKDPVPEDVDARVDRLSKLMANSTRQIMTVNEAREYIDLDPLGAEFDVINNQPQVVTPPEQPKSLKNISLTKHLRRQGIFEKAEQDKNLHKAAREVAKKIIEKRKVKGKVEPRRYRSLSNEAAIEYWSKQIHIAEAVEQKFANKIDQFLATLEDKAVKNLGHAMKKTKAFTLFNEDEEIRSGIDLFTPLSEEIATLAGGEAYQLLNVRTAYAPSKDLRKRVEEAVTNFTESFVASDREKLTDILISGISDGLSVAQMERKIRDEFGSYRKSQAEKIARTESIRASNEGALDAFKQSGVVEAKQWLTAEDDRVDGECEELDGKIVELDGDFFEADFGSGEEPPLHPNCRCVLIPVIMEK